MGLKFYRNPEEIDAEKDAAAKLDRAAAQRRSPIRREPSIRPHRDQSSYTNVRTSTTSQNHMMMERYQLQLAQDNDRVEQQINRLDAQLRALRQQREARQMMMVANATRLNRNVMSTLPILDVHNASSESLNQTPLPQPGRESNLRYETAATSNSRPGSPRQELHSMPSPPQSLNDDGRSRPVDGPLEPWDTVPPLSQDFAPARHSHSQAVHDNTDSNSSVQPVRDISNSEQVGLETPPPETWENTYPPLRRVPHMSPRPVPREPIEDSGDRHTSHSPAPESHEESTWNTLLATMDHGDNTVSTSTSFASTTDLQPTSRSSSQRSYHTQSTSTSFGEIGSSSDETCDLPPGITEQDVRMIRERHRRVSRRFTRLSTQERLSHAVGNGVSTTTGSPRSGPSPMSRTLLRQAAEAIEREAGSEAGLLNRVAAFRNIFESMERSEHIPDHIWAMFGLPSEFVGQT